MKATKYTLLAFVALALALSWSASGEEAKEGKKGRDAPEPVALASVENPPAEVWWGNGAVSFRNYIEFDRIDIPKPRDPPFGPIYFDLDKSLLRPDGIAICNQVLDYMTRHPEKRVTIEGHCCDLATNEYNIGLGQRRADSVRRWLIEHGIESSRMETVSYGEERRATTAPTERPLNRRAVVIVKFTN